MEDGSSAKPSTRCPVSRQDRWRSDECSKTSMIPRSTASNSVDSLSLSPSLPRCRWLDDEGHARDHALHRLAIHWIPRTSHECRVDLSGALNIVHRQGRRRLFRGFRSTARDNKRCCEALPSPSVPCNQGSPIRDSSHVNVNPGGKGERRNRWRLSMTSGLRSWRDGALKRDRRYSSGSSVKAAERSTAFSLPTSTTPATRSLSWNVCPPPLRCRRRAGTCARALLCARVGAPLGGYARGEEST